jgi:histidinol-phosphate aminotransferase
MSRRSIDRAIVLAAGRGSRLVSGAPYPKPLKPVAGVPLLVRILRGLATQGIREAVVVVGFQGDQIRRALNAERGLGLAVTFAENALWEKSNGVSLLQAAAHIDRDCILTMADHLFAPEIVARLAAADLPAGACSLGVDYDIERCFDLDDATKVQVEAGHIAQIAKDLPEYNAIDTGVFRITPRLIDELARLEAEKGDASLSDGVRALAQRGMFFATDVGDARWIDVDTPEAHARAEAMVRVFGDALGDEPSGTPVIDAEAMELFSPSWVRGASPYREDHFTLADARPKTGKKPRPIARLMSNESPFEPSTRVVEAVMSALSRGHLYPDAALSAELRRRLAGEAELGDESCVLGAGSSEIIDVAVRTFVAPGEEVLIAVPTFSMYEARTRVAGGVPVLVPMSEDLSLDVQGVLAAVTERTKLIFLCSPNNPTGIRPEETDVRRILRLGLPTVIDEAYLGFDELGGTAASLIHEYPNAIIIRTFSKAYGLAGLRIGYALSSAPVARLMSRVKLPWNVSTVALAAALAVLDDEAEFSRRRDILRAERAYLEAEFSKMPGVAVYGTEGNFLLLDIHETGLTANGVVQAMLADGVLIRSLASHHLRRGFVRVSIGAPEENRRCVDAMRRVLTRARAANRPAAS